MTVRRPDTINPPRITRQLFVDAARPKFMLTLLRSGHLPPYTDDRHQPAVVERVTIAFLGYYFKHAPLRQLLAAGEASGIARLTSRPSLGWPVRRSRSSLCDRDAASAAVSINAEAKNLRLAEAGRDA